MYFREKETKNGRLLQLVRGNRGLDGKVRQQVVLSLGGCQVPDIHRHDVVRLVENAISGQPELFSPSPEAVCWADMILDRMRTEGKLELARKMVSRSLPEGVVADGVLIDKVCHSDVRAVGVLLPLRQAWDALGITEFLLDAGMPARRVKAAQACVFNRLVEPCSEHELPSWIETVALDELLDERFSSFGKEIFYRAGDDLLEHCEALGRHLREREASLFNLGNTILLYDLTNSYFEGDCLSNPKARRSRNSKEKRTDCPLLSVGLVLNREGFPIVHKVFAGNASDSGTILDIIGELRTAAGDTGRPTVVLDGGIATAANLALLLSNNYDYVVNGKRTTRQNFAEDFADIDNFQAVRGRDDKKPVFVKRLWTDHEVTLLCRSDDRKAKEDAMVSKTEEKYLEALKKLEARITKNDGRLHLDGPDGAARVNQCAGRIASRYTRASKFYSVTYDAKERRLSWTRNDEKYQEDAALHGCYHLRTSRMDLTDDEIWLVYIMLTHVETAFHLLKGELGLRPFYHWKEDRCNAHVWITVLAYHILRWTEYSLRLAGIDSTWMAVRRLLQTHCYATITMPCQNGSEYQIRRPGKPDERQRLIYRALNIDVASLPVTRKKIEPAGESPT